LAESVRLDKWLWAARFFRTRNLAKQAIETGKVYYDGARPKVSREVQVGAMLRIRQGWDETTVEVLALSDQRRGAPEAALLYRETAESVTGREQRAGQRRAANLGRDFPGRRPDKRQRRQIHRFLRDVGDDGAEP
jgi:ribosome-associated heat shock protein Hsp15